MKMLLKREKTGLHEKLTNLPFETFKIKALVILIYMTLDPFS